MLNHSDYTLETIGDIVRLRRRLAGLPPKQVDENLLVCSWNIRAFGRLFDAWTENDDSPKRNLRGLAIIAEVVRRFDVIAVQEVKRETVVLRRLLADFLGPPWAVVLSDITAGDKGNTERFAFIYDTRRVRLSGLAGEIVLPPTVVEVAEADGTVRRELHPTRQFARTPYIVGFESCGERFSLLTAHIEYGEGADDRVEEITGLAAYTASEIRDRAADDAEYGSLIVLGDFNIDKRTDDALFQAFTETGLVVPAALNELRTTYGTEPKYYDQIAWFMGTLDLDYTGRGGVIDFVGAVFREMTTRSMTYRVSDHFPLWVEFRLDRSEARMAERLGVDPAAPDPLSVVPD